MSVNLERFHYLFRARQSLDVYKLVNSQRGWLNNVQPGTVERYGNLYGAFHNVGRLARSKELKAYVIREDKIAKGLATIIFNQHVLHPTEGLVEGDDLDYWLVKNASSDVHLDTVSALIIESHRRFIHRRHGLPRLPKDISHPSMFGRKSANEHQMIASVPLEHPNPSIGFTNWQAMDRIGGPAYLATAGPDKFDVARAGVLSQLYKLNVERLPN